MQNMNKEMRVVLYHNDENNISVNAVVQNDSIWITQKAMAELFGVNTPAINKHLKNIYDEGELTESSTISKMEIVQSEGSRQVKRNVDFYNLDAITCDKQKNIGIIWIKDIPEYTKGYRPFH